MKVSTFFVFALTVVSLAAVISSMRPEHYPMGQCMCQRGGERGGHCHCPDWAKMHNHYCRYGGNHWICFPFGRK